MTNAFDYEVTRDDRDLSTVRTYQIEKNTLRLTREDPYGFWSFSFERGQIPKVLEGYFTSPRQAEIKLETYLQNKDKEVTHKTT